MTRSKNVGQWGEALATELLIKKGYAIVKQNWHMEHYEIDIIAMHGGRIVFVEVKTRSSADDNPASAVDIRKMRRMAVSAHQYVITKNIPHEIQFDIITITGTEDNYTIEHIEDAFLSPLKTY